MSTGTQSDACRVNDSRLEAAYEGALTLGAFRELTQQLSDETPLVVAVRDLHHFDTLLADIRVPRASVALGPRTHVIVFDVPGVT